MEIKKPIIPKETDADVAMSVFIPCIDYNTQGNVKYSYTFKGVFERTALGDALQLFIKNRVKEPSTVTFSLNRDSFYHILPEYLFHPIDRYYGIRNDSGEFDKRYDEQEEQEKNALTYFNFFDQEYQKLRVTLQTWLNEHVFKGNMFLSDFITRDIPFNRSNPFIMAVYPCLPWLRSHRGNRQMMETALSYAFSGCASVDYQREKEQMALDEGIHSSAEGTIDDLFCGATFCTRAYCWHVRYQSPIGTEARLADLQKDIKEFADFFATWFVAIEDHLQIEFGDWQEPPVLTSLQSPTGIFLNYSTQLI